MRPNTIADAFYERCVLEAIEKHSDVLLRKYAQGVVEDNYGVRDTNKWRKDAEYFVDTVLIQEFGESLLGVPRQTVFEMIDREIGDLFDKRRSEAPATVSMSDITPIEYEHYCADLLRRAGWTITVHQGERRPGRGHPGPSRRPGSSISVQEIFQPSGQCGCTGSQCRPPLLLG